jgi:hypothetical protein
MTAKSGRANDCTPPQATLWQAFWILAVRRRCERLFRGGTSAWRRDALGRLGGPEKAQTVECSRPSSGPTRRREGKRSGGYAVWSVTRRLSPSTCARIWPRTLLPFAFHRRAEPTSTGNQEKSRNNQSPDNVIAVPTCARSCLHIPGPFLLPFLLSWVPLRARTAINSQRVLDIPVPLACFWPAP